MTEKLCLTDSWFSGKHGENETMKSLYKLSTNNVITVRDTQHEKQIFPDFDTLSEYITNLDVQLGIFSLNFTRIHLQLFV